MSGNNDNDRSDCGSAEWIKKYILLCNYCQKAADTFLQRISTFCGKKLSILSLKLGNAVARMIHMRYDESVP